MFGMPQLNLKHVTAWAQQFEEGCTCFTNTLQTGSSTFFETELARHAKRFLPFGKYGNFGFQETDATAGEAVALKLNVYVTMIAGMRFSLCSVVFVAVNVHHCYCLCHSNTCKNKISCHWEKCEENETLPQACLLVCQVWSTHSPHTHTLTLINLKKEEPWQAKMCRAQFPLNVFIVISYTTWCMLPPRITLSRSCCEVPGVLNALLLTINAHVIILQNLERYLRWVYSNHTGSSVD